MKPNDTPGPESRKCPKHWRKKEWWANCKTCPETVSASHFAPDTPPEALSSNNGIEVQR